MVKRKMSRRIKLNLPGKETFPFALVLFSIIFFLILKVQGQSPDPLIYNADSSLSRGFLDEICSAVRSRADIDLPGQPTKFESLISMAAGTGYKSTEQPVKIKNWWLKYKNQCNCGENKKIDAGHLLEQLIAADFRNAANLIGPNGRLDLALEVPYSGNGTTVLQYSRIQLDIIEEKYNHERIRFQKNKNWKRLMFYFMLFTEYQVQYEVKMDEFK